MVHPRVRRACGGAGGLVLLDQRGILDAGGISDLCVLAQLYIFPGRVRMGDRGHFPDHELAHRLDRLPRRGAFRDSYVHCVNL